MERPAQDLAPWEVPPDEMYWQALLQEGEYGEGAAFFSAEEDRDQELEQEASVAQQDDPAVHRDARPAEPETEPRPASGEPDCWETFASYQAEGKPVELKVVDFNRGGLLVKWNSVIGFVPASQLCDGLPYDDERARRKALADRVGCTLTLKVIEVDSSKNRLIFSERAARRVEEPDTGILDELNPGDVRPGRITNLCAFGAFVDLGGVEGLIHISELSWGRVSHPTDVLQSGQEIEVYVLNVDRKSGRVGLSLKRLQPDPWDTAESRYRIGQIVEGTVTSVVNFGAFVRIEDGLEGLIHASDLTGGAGVHRRVLHEGEVIQVCIRSIDGTRHRVGLSLERT